MFVVCPPVAERFDCVFPSVSSLLFSVEHKLSSEPRRVRLLGHHCFLLASSYHVLLLPMHTLLRSGLAAIMSLRIRNVATTGLAALQLPNGACFCYASQ